MATTTLPATRPALTCQVLTRTDQLSDWQGSWLDLLHRSAADEVMLSPTWLKAWWDLYGQNPGSELRVGLFFAGKRLVGLAPLLARTVRHYRVLPFRRLELLGSDHDQPDAICSDYLNVIAERGSECLVARAFVDALQTGRFGPWDEVWLPVMDADGPMPELLMESFQRANCGTIKSAYHDAPYLALPPTWDAYLADLPQRKRYFINRTLREFENWTAGAYQLRRATTPAELAEGERHLQSLHAERWSREGSAGVFQSERFRAFHHRVMTEMLGLGALELRWLEVRGEPLAALYCLTWNGKVSFYQCGRKLAVPEKQRPGIVLLCLAIQEAIGAGLREFDFLAGVSRYKMDFNPRLRGLVQIRAVRPGWREVLRRGVERSLNVARRVRQPPPST